MSGIFITIEGPDGAGKTSVAMSCILACKCLQKKALLKQREPGGSKIAEKFVKLF